MDPSLPVSQRIKQRDKAKLLGKLLFSEWKKKEWKSRLSWHEPFALLPAYNTCKYNDVNELHAKDDKIGRKEGTLVLWEN